MPTKDVETLLQWLVEQEERTIGREQERDLRFEDQLASHRDWVSRRFDYQNRKIDELFGMVKDLRDK